MRVWGSFNDPQIADVGSRTYSNTFWIIFGTSNCFTQSGPWHPLFITKTLQRIQEKSPSFFRQYYFYISQQSVFPNFYQCWKRRAPTNPAESSNEMLKTFDMKPISIKKPIWYQYLLQKIKMTFLEFCNFGIFGINMSWPPGGHQNKHNYFVGSRTTGFSER